MARITRAQLDAQRQLNSTGARPCPTPDKRRYSSRGVAKSYALKHLYAYECRCGWWHLASSRGRKR